uniref:Potassium transporter 10-like isoform X2 n=1 Tax=Rhizophora mucronata TaxID=61149 RepID=A0A2P2PFD6_RHIMU
MYVMERTFHLYSVDLQFSRPTDWVGLEKVQVWATAYVSCCLFCLNGRLHSSSKRILPFR